MTLKDVKPKMYTHWEWRRSMAMRIALEPVVPLLPRLGECDCGDNFCYESWVIWSRRLGIYAGEGKR